MTCFPLESSAPSLKRSVQKELAAASAHGVKFLMADAIPTFTYLVFQLKTQQPKLAFLHVEPRVIGMDNRNERDIGAHEGNEFIQNLWAGPKSSYIDWRV